MKIKVLTNQGREIVINSDDLKIQQRAGIGTNVFKLKKNEYIVHSYIIDEE